MKDVINAVEVKRNLNVARAILALENEKPNSYNSQHLEKARAIYIDNALKLVEYLDFETSAIQNVINDTRRFNMTAEHEQVKKILIEKLSNELG